VQTLEVRFSQGKIRFQAEGDFQAGEKVRLSFPGNGAVTVEKGPMPSAQGDAAGVGYTLPQNMSSLKDLRAFEENLVQWMAGGKASGAPADAAARGALMRLTLPQLMQKAMDKQGGKEMLGPALAGLDPGAMSALMDALEAGPGEAAAKAPLLELLKTLANRMKASAWVPPDPNPMPAGEGRGSGGNAVQAPVRAALAGNTGTFMPAESGPDHAPWFGRIVDKRQADGFLTPMQRLQFGGPPRNEPMYRYVLDMGGRTMEVFSSQSLEPGVFTDFQLERRGGRVQARFSDPAISLPAGLRTAMAGASGDLKQGMLLASHYLQDFRGEPYYGQLVEDFGEVVAQSGRLHPPAADGKPAGIPDQKELDGLLKLFVAYPRDALQPERQARAWGDAVRDPQAMMKLLRNLRPDQDASLLRARTALHLAADGTAQGRGARDPVPAAVEALLSAASHAGESPEATAAWLKKLLPEAFRAEDVAKLARDASSPATAGKEHEAARFLLQAVAHAFPREDQIQEGRPSQFYFYQGQEWRNLQVTWERGGGNQGRGKAGPKAPLQVRVETRARNMGQVNVAVSWEPKGAKLDFRNQFHDVRDLLSRSLPELEKSLALMDFHVTAWSYELLPEAGPAIPDPGWTRPASLSDGTNLDLMG
ncbi:MAG TPA: hypothetical protein VJ385_01190, partial [Fibrobacteria bacterium]|nr:hypothetical protein [Fibrobacteria bacterium]